MIEARTFGRIGRDIKIVRYVIAVVDRFEFGHRVIAPFREEIDPVAISVRLLGKIRIGNKFLAGTNAPVEHRPDLLTRDEEDRHELTLAPRRRGSPDYIPACRSVTGMMMTTRVPPE
jgi:hypothetical protein